MRTTRAQALLSIALLTAVLPALGVAPSTASAQTQGGIDITLFSVSQNGTEIRQMGDGNFATRGYNASECAAADSITTEFTLLNLPAGATFVDVWLGNGTQDCSTVEARQTGNGRVCTHLAADPTIATSSVTLTLSEMLDPDDNPCENTVAVGANYTLWFFAAGSTETTAAVTSDQYGFVSFKVDVQAPATPALTTTGPLSGSQSVSIGWDALASEMSPRFRLFVDDTVMTCDGTSQWAPGDPAPTEDDGEVSANQSSVSLAGLALGSSALVYVASVDQSDNVSALSQAVCVTRVETVGFCEALDASGQPCTNTCVAGGPRALGTRPTPQAAWLGCALLALAIRRRSRS